MPQNVPAACEVAGQEEHQQDADQLHRLETEQIDLGVARPGPASEYDQQHGKHATSEQRDETGLIEEVLEVDAAQASQQQAAHHYALREIHEDEVVAERIAQADHQREPEAAQQQDHRQQRLVPTEFAGAPPQMRRQENREERNRPQKKRLAKLSRLPHHEERLQFAKLIARHQRANAAHVRELTGKRVDPLGLRGAICRRNRVQERQQVFARGERIQIQKLLRRKLLLHRYQVRGLAAVHLQEAKGRNHTRYQQQCQFARSPAGPLSRYAANLFALYSPTASDGHGLIGSLLRITAAFAGAMPISLSKWQTAIPAPCCARCWAVVLSPRAADPAPTESPTPEFSH